MKRRILTLVLALVLAAGLFPAGAFAADFKFVDVSPEAWYYGDVKTAVDAGLVNGKSDTTYCPDDNLTYAEAVKLAAAMHQKNETGTVSLVNGNPWYQSYVDYAKMKNIIAKDYDWGAKATRAGYMAIFAHALPDASLAGINEVPDGSIPDVPMSRAEAPEIYKLYRAGILQGSDDKFSCKPDDNIRRSEVAAILTRMMYTATRKSFTTVKTDAPKPETPKTDPLKIVKSPQSAALKDVNDKLSFTVEISGGKAPYNYKWFIEKETGSNFQQVDSEKKASTYNVTFSKDSFTFTKYIRIYVEVTDAEGTKVTSEKAEITAFVENTPALKITKQPVSQSGRENTMVSFTVEVEGGKAPYTYRWEATQGGDIFGGITCANVSGEFTKTLTVLLEKSTYPEGENIRCVITDANGKSVVTDSVKAVLIADDMKITKQPQDYVMKSDSDVPTFDVEITGGKAPYTFIWHEDLQYIAFTVTGTGSTGANRLSVPEADVMVAQTGFDDYVLIWCEIIDANGAKISTKDARLFAPAPAAELKITKQPADYTMKSDSDVPTFDVEVTGGKAPYTFVWHEDLQYIAFTVTGTGSTGANRLSVPEADVMVAQTGFDDYVLIWCEIIDANGAKISTKDARLFAPAPAAELKITKQPLSYYALEGWDMELKIEVSGGKAPYTYEWQYNEQMNFWETIQMGAKEGKCYVDSDGTLHITVSYYDWTGNSYIRCVVTDANGDQVISKSVDFSAG